MTTRRYAEDTSVPVQRSRNEIEALLQRYGAEGFGFETEFGSGGRALVKFAIRGRLFRIPVRTCSISDPRIQRHPAGKQRTSVEVEGAWQQEERRAWRVAVLWLKGTLEAVESRVITLDEALLPFMVLPDNRTVGEWAEPQIARALEERRMPALMPGGGE